MKADRGLTIARMVKLGVVSRASYYRYEEDAAVEPDRDMELRDAIQRIAIVGNERWRAEMLMFAAADLRRAPVEFFPEGELTKARAWLSA